MKKTIKLTEKQFNDIVKKVVMEQESEDIDYENDVISAISDAEYMLGDFEPSDRSNRVKHIEELKMAIDEKIHQLKKLKQAIGVSHLKSIYRH